MAAFPPGSTPIGPEENPFLKIAIPKGGLADFLLNLPIPPPFELPEPEILLTLRENIDREWPW